MDLHVDLDRMGRRSALEAALRAAIRSGRLTPASRLPSTRALAAELRLARGTVTEAYGQLVAEGYLRARTGSGTVVADVAPSAPARRPPPAEDPEPRYDLRPGRPDVSAFPISAWVRATRHALATASHLSYDYGDPRGRRELREALAGYLGRTRGVLADPDRIVVTSGYVQALALLAGVVGGPFAMEDPGLPFHRDVVRHAGAAVVALPVDELGARTDALPALVRAAVLTPAHQYPTGVTLHPRRRRAAVDWARDTGGLIIEDDYDGEYRYDRQPVGAIQGTGPDQVVYVGTASKTLAPALRLGWAVVPAGLLDQVVEAKRYADLHTETIGQLALAELINTHAYDRQVRAGRLRYRRRRDLLVERLGRQPFAVRGIAAGLHALVSLDGRGPAEEELLARAAARGLALGGLRPHWHGPAPDGVGGVIVGYGSPTAAVYPRALSVLVRVLADIRR